MTAAVALAMIASRALAQEQRPMNGRLSGPQRPWRLSVKADNDAFNFWKGITARPDEEYTNGDVVTLEVPTAPLWGKRLAARRAACTGTEAVGERCLTTTFSLGQEMYTPKPGREPGNVPDWRDERPYAAWLYVAAAGRVMSERTLRTVGLTLGVTGPPAFGEFTQRTAHALTGVYSRDPVGWETQIGFEPGAVISARESRRLVARNRAGRAVADVVPHVGASVGNILTAMDVGAEARLGFDLSHPWWMSEWRTRQPIEAFVVAGVRGQAVARNITLDGNTVEPTRRVDRRPLVGEYSIGIGARYRGIVGGWRAVVRSREYATGPASHAHSTLYGALEVPARGGR